MLYQKYSSTYLCREHFIEDVERKIKRDIRKYRMIEKNDTIAVALSGGKDSTALLYTLHKLFHRRPDVRLIAITIDEGIKGYREHTLKHAQSLTEQLNITHVIRSFTDYFGVGLDEMIRSGRNPCTICGVLRKKLLNATAIELHATKLAIGHNLDDEAQTILMNYLRADIERMMRMIPGARQPGLVPRIKPLRSIPEREVALYIYLQGLPLDVSTCPYAATALRGDVRELLNNYEAAHPGTKYALLGGFEKITESLVKTHTIAPLKKCTRCGGPTGNTTTCKACQILSETRNNL